MEGGLNEGIERGVQMIRDNPKYYIIVTDVEYIVRGWRY